MMKRPRIIKEGWTQYDPDSPVLHQSPKSDAPQWVWDEFEKLKKQFEERRKKGLFV